MAPTAGTAAYQRCTERGAALSLIGEVRVDPRYQQEPGDLVAAGQAQVPIHRTYRLDEIAQAHEDMEAGRATGKLVVLP